MLELDFILALLRPSILTITLVTLLLCSRANTMILLPYLLRVLPRVQAEARWQLQHDWSVLGHNHRRLTRTISNMVQL